LLLLSGWCGNSEEIIMAIWAVLLWTLLRTLRTWQSNQSFAPAAFSLFGVIYIGFSFTHLILLRDINSSVLAPTLLVHMSLGTVYLWVAFLATWSSDSFAYFIGTALGRHKLCPSISPHKSVEGFIGGVIGAILAALVFGHFTAIPLIHRLMTGMLVGLVSPVGDLAESALKRYCGVKDSGSLLPGHGGVLDRFDSLLFSVPVIYYYVRLIILQ
jgi:phosphatidate cytidylyltransferase